MANSMDSQRLLRGYLEAESFAVSEAATGSEALALVRSGRPDVVLLDVRLPDLGGIEVLREIRSFSDVFVLLVTARSDEVDKLVGLAVGADDYITKPFSPREVVARVRTVLRRSRGAEPAATRLVFPGLVVDADARQVTVDGHQADVTALEFDLLSALARTPGRVYSRRQLLENVWDGDFFGEEVVDEVEVDHLGGVGAGGGFGDRFSCVAEAEPDGVVDDPLGGQ